MSFKKKMNFFKKNVILKNVEFKKKKGQEVNFS